MDDSERVRTVILPLEKAFDPSQRLDRELLKLLIALDAFTTADEGYLVADQREDSADPREAPIWRARRYWYILMTAGAIAEAFKAFLFVDDRGWFDEHLPQHPEHHEQAQHSLEQLRALSELQTPPAKACACCGKSHQTDSRPVRLPPEPLRRLRDKAAYHWDSAALRDAYKRLCNEKRTPAIVRSTGKSLRTMHSPLAADLILALTAGPGDGAADLQLIAVAGEHLRVLVQLTFADYLHSRGARLVVSD